MIRFSSGNVDILVLLLWHSGTLVDIRCLVDNGTEKNCKIIDMSTTRLSALECQALAGTHSFSGNDYISSFFKKGKKYFWKKVRSNQQLLKTFANLGRRNELCKELNKGIKNFICVIYGYTRLRSVNQVRKEIFVRKFEQEGKTTDLSLLPPCASNLNMHTKRV